MRRLTAFVIVALLAAVLPAAVVPAQAQVVITPAPWIDVSGTARGPIVFPSSVPADTTNKLYNDAGAIYFNGSLLSGGTAFWARAGVVVTTGTAGDIVAPDRLHVGGTSDPGDNNLLVDGTLTVSGSGPHAIGGAVDGSSRLILTGTFTPSGANAWGINYAGTLNVPANGYGAYAYWDGTLVEAGSGTHTLLAGNWFQQPTITGAASTVTNTATVYIAGAPSATVTGANYALWVDDGISKLDGRLELAKAGSDTPGDANVLFNGNYFSIRQNAAQTAFYIDQYYGGVFHPVLSLASGVVSAEVALAIGTNPASAGAVRLASGAQVVYRNAANDGNLSAIYSDTAANGMRFGDALTPTHIASNGVAPANVDTGSMWIEYSGTTISLKVYHGGAARTVATITY